MKTLLRKTKVRTGKNTFAEAVGFDGDSGKILFAGSNTEADKIKIDYDEVIEPKDKLVIPAFTDAHCHLIKGSQVNSEVNLRNASTKKDFAEAISEFINDNNPAWVTGGYFADSNFKEKFTPDRNFLDSISTDVPIIISRFDHHSAMANSKAIEISAIENKKNEFTTDEISLDSGGALTGELKERAMYYVLGIVPVRSIKEKAEALKKEIEKLYAFGITGVSDITLLPDLDVYEYLKKGGLDFRLNSIIPFEEFGKIQEIKERFEEYKNIKFGCFKAFYDGSLSSETAYFHKSYKGTSNAGIRTEIVNSGEFERIAYEIDKAGCQMAVHAIGDRSVTELLNLNEELQKKHGIRDRRFRIEHAQHIRKSDLHRFKELGVIASVQPGHLFSDAVTAFNKVEDVDTTHNYKLLMESGAMVCFGTDFPIISENPFENIYYAVTRKAEGFEKGFLPEYKISPDECIEAYTANSVYASYEENIRGKIKVGMDADITVIDDIYSAPPDEIKNCRAYSTYIAGRKVF